jgi:hypothetical protein
MDTKFDEYFSTLPPVVPIIPFIENILITVFLAYLLAYVYNKYGSTFSNRKQFSKNFILVSATTMLIITIVKSSLALSLGLVGALSIVRFRAAIKEPEELAFLFLCIAIGLGLGAAQREVTIIGFLIILAIIFFKYRFSPSKEANPNLYLNFQYAPEHKIKLENVQYILKENCSEMRLIRFDESENSCEFIYLVNFFDFNRMNQCSKQLKELGALNISFLEKSN